MLDSYGRPALTGLVRMHALERNQQGLRLLRDGELHDPGWSRAVLAALSAGSACWHVLRPMLEPDRWQRVKHSLHVQRELLRPLYTPETGVLVPHREALAGLAPHALTSAQQRCMARLLGKMPDEGLAGLARRQCQALERHLSEQGEWLGQLAGSRTADDAGLRRAMVHVYGRARGAFCAAPDASKARRRLSRLAWVEELLAAPAGPIREGAWPDSASARLWLRLEEGCWLRALERSGAARGLGRKDRAHLAKLVSRRRKELARGNIGLARAAVGQPVQEFATALPLTLLSRLVWPEPLCAGRQCG